MDGSIQESGAQAVVEPEFARRIMDIRDAAGLDDIDRHILDLLLADARLSNVEIAKVVGSTETTVRRRIASMQRFGVVRNFSALLQLKKFGNFVKVIINLRVRKRNLRQVAKDFSSMNNVISVYRTMGEDDLTLEVLFKDLTEFQVFMDGLQAKEEIKSSEYLIVSESYRSCPWCGL